MNQKFTARFQEALASAQSLAVGKDHNYIEPAHILYALLNQEGGGSAAILRQAGVNVNGLRSGLDNLIRNLPVVKNATGQVNISPETARLINLCDKMAQKNGDEHISSELFLLAVLDAMG